MKITTIDKGTAEAITSRLHDAVRDVADSMGVTVYVERTKFSTVEMSVTFSIKLPADKTEFPHYVYDGDDDRLIGDTVDRWDFTEVYMNKTFGVTRLSVLRELLERFRRTEPSPENVQDVADALKRLSMEPRSEALRIAVIEQLRRVLR